MAPVCDRGFYFGDGIYEALRVENHKPFALDEHLERFYKGLAALRIDFSMPESELKRILSEVSNRVDSKSQLLYFQVTRGTAVRTHAFPEDAKPNLMAYAHHAPLKDVSERWKLILLPDIRWANCNIKTLNLIPNIMAAQQAKERGCNEAVFHRDGVVTECASSNLLMLSGGVLRTAPADHRILGGVTRARFLLLAKQLDIPVVEEAFTLDEAFSADELMVVSTSVHGPGVCELEGRPVGGKDPERLKKLQSAFRAFFRESVR
jgi:D-alanine transaminase